MGLQSDVDTGPQNQPGPTSQPNGPQGPRMRMPQPRPQQTQVRPPPLPAGGPNSSINMPSPTQNTMGNPIQPNTVSLKISFIFFSSA